MKKIAILAAVTAVIISSPASAAILSIDNTSKFDVEVSTGFFLTTMISGQNGIDVGTVQNASGSHMGAPDGTEVANIDKPWSFFGATGMHETRSPSNILSITNDTALIDLSGLGFDWNGLEMSLGGGAWAGNADGVGEIVCATGSGCVEGSGYTLTYSAIINDPAGTSGFGGLNYRLIVNGVIMNGDLTAVPVPAALWLFVSGLLGFASVVRRKTAS